MGVKKFMYCIHTFPPPPPPTHPPPSELNDSPAAEGTTHRLLPRVRQQARSIKHAMSRVKDHNHTSSRVVAGGGGGSGAGAATDDALSSMGSPRAGGNGSRAAGGGGGGSHDAEISAASIAVSRYSLESAMSGGDGGEDLDSPRNRGRAYDDRWKVNFVG